MRVAYLIFILKFLILSNSFCAGKIRRTTMVDGKLREYFLHIPTGFNNNSSIPLVFMLHGTGGDGERMYEESGWAELAEKEKFIAVFPSSLKYNIIDHDGNKSTTKWNITPDSEFTFQPGEKGFDDIKFLRKVIDEIKSSLNIDEKRIYLNGFSNGGAMAARCAVEMSDLLAAVCSNASSFFLDTTYIPKRKLPYLFQVGNRDYGPGNVGPEFPEAPMKYFDSLISTPNLPYLQGKHYKIANNVIRNFGLKSEHTAIVGDTNVAVFTTYFPRDPKENHEFRYVFVKDLGHLYPNWAPTRHWEWMKNFKLENSISSSMDDLNQTKTNFFYPNPTQSMILFNEERRYKIMDCNGKLVKEGVGYEVELNDLRNGVYFVNSGLNTGKLIVLR